MPFTPAHSAIILPFIKINPRYVSATALIAGSFAPDFEYFFKMSVDSTFSHSIRGLFLFDVPTVLILSLAFHSIVKKNLIRNFPVFLQSRLGQLEQFQFIPYLKKHPIAFVASAIVGSASHIFWDSFTHSDGFFVKVIPFYHGSFIPYEGANYPLWYALQHVSTWVGLTIIFLYLLRMKIDNTIMITKPNILYWLLLIVFAALAVTIRFAIKSSDYNLGNFIVTSISGVCIGLLLCGCIKFKIRQ